MPDYAAYVENAVWAWIMVSIVVLVLAIPTAGWIYDDVWKSRWVWLLPLVGLVVTAGLVTAVTVILYNAEWVQYRRETGR